MNLTTFATRATTAVVAGVAGFSSYRHIVEVAQRAGEHTAVAAVLPLSIDGLIVVGTMAMVEDRRALRPARLSARVALVVGVVATLAANIASAQPHVTARLVAAVPAVAFLITVEVLARAGRAANVSPPAFDPYAPPKPPAGRDEPATDADADEPAQVDNLSTPEPPKRKSPPSSRERVLRAHARTPDASNADLAARLQLHPKTVSRHRPERPDAAVNGHVPDLEEVSS